MEEKKSKRGGARPNSGGRRPGAGRKLMGAEKKLTKTICISPLAVKAFDAIKAKGVSPSNLIEKTLINAANAMNIPLE